ncbi:MAG TPA: alginate lyase family protein [Rariglobus sp.]
MIRLPRLGLFLLSLFVGQACGAFAQGFVHPGGLHTQADLDRMKAKVAAGESPWIDGWNALLQDGKAKNDYKAGPHRHMISRQRAQNDATAAYLNTLRWIISGDTSHANCAVRILNDWSETMAEVPKGDNMPGLSGIPIGTFAIAAELLRSYPGWSAADQARFKRMLLDYMYPVCHDFLVNHNGARVDHYWANWDTCNMRAVLAIGVFCDDRAKFNEAVEYFKNGRGNGALRIAAPYRFPGGLAQWQESGRDYAHVMGGQGLLAEMCQIAWNQGVDLFGYDDNLLLAGAEHTAQYTLWKGVPYTSYNNSDNPRQFYISTNYHGRLDASHFELLYNHYVVRQGLKAPNVQLFAALRRPEPGETDVLGYGTLTYTRDAKASPLAKVPPTPREVVATPGLQRVELKWSPSGAYSAHGYEVGRATSPDGPFTSIYSTKRWTTPSYVDSAVEAGRTYYYTVAALNNAGKSVPSAPVSVVPDKGETLPPVCRSVSVEGALYAKASVGNSFLVPATGREMDGSFAGLPMEGDFSLTARLANWQGPVGLMGLTVREPGAGKSRALAVTLSGRTAHFRTRVDGKTTTQRGCDYTWIPVWLRLRRVGDEFTAYQSSDGIEWFEIGKSTVALPKGVLAGLLASTGETPPGRKETDAPKGIFDHVRIERQPPAPPAAPVALTATPLAGGVVRLDWKNPVPTSQTGVKIEASLDGAPFYEIADLAPGASRFENTGIEQPAALRYRIRAYNTGGYSAYSNTAQRDQ